jgi:hypothetical protein
VEGAAGAGLEAVLETDDETRAHLFPDGINAASIGADQTLNLRELPIALQLPDWNRWLPEIHPVDVWGDYFLATTPVDGSDGDSYGDVLGHYDILVYRLETEGVQSLIDRNKLTGLVKDFSGAGVTYFLQNDYGGGLQNMPGGMAPEVGKTSIRRWTNVKLWEVHNSFELDGRAPEIYGTYGEARSWLGAHRQMFDLSPHLSADVPGGFAYQTPIAGQTESKQWYQLQSIVNAGNRAGYPTRPVDWNYHPMGTGYFENSGALTHPYRIAAAWIKLIQLFHNLDRPFGDLEEAYVRQAHPALWADMGSFKGLAPQERADLFSAILSAYMDKVEMHEVTEWNRPAGANTPGRWEPASYVPSTVQGTWSYLHMQGLYADLWYTMIPYFRADGVHNAVLTRMIDWGEAMWPLGNWDALRGPGATLGEGDGLRGTYFWDVSLLVPDFERVDPVVDFDWQWGRPGGNLGNDLFSVRWAGFVTPYFTGPITFHVRSNDGARLWVDGDLIINRWVSGPGVGEESGTINLIGGEPVSIRLEYYDATGLAEVELDWSSPWTQREVVPDHQLYTQRPEGARATAGLPEALELAPAAPNPFAAHTTLAYALPADGPARIAVYDLLGRQVAVLVDGVQPAGRYTAVLDADGLASGVYFVRLEAGNETQTQKVLVAR